ncbi:MAG: dTMP kinase [Leptospiraceae bacterium]|nr:dTMP kinase [Leptospiraceae bacterium]MCP5513554.1 dTMP kinase [Leptospiraceae bacterium]
MEKPFFLVLEGIDGSGKTTLISKLSESLQKNGIPVDQYFEPTKRDTGLRIRQFLSGEISLNPEEQIEAFIEDRKESVKYHIIPSLQKGNSVLLDRYYYSTAAYQGNEKITPQEILNRNIKEGFPSPDYLFFLDVSPEESIRRIAQRNESREVFEKKEILEKIYSNFSMILPETCIRIPESFKTEDSVNLILRKIGIKAKES